MSDVLVLNATYEPINVCEWKRAVVLIIKNKAEVIEHKEKLIGKNFWLPAVIKLKYYVKIPYEHVSITRKNILYRDNYTCQYCGKEKQRLTIDHIIPKSRGGTDSWENMVTACVDCNVKKGDRTPDEANMSLIRKTLPPPSKIFFEISKYKKMKNKYWEKYLIMW